jgi:hypothetical protein
LIVILVALKSKVAIPSRLLLLTLLLPSISKKSSQTAFGAIIGGIFVAITLMSVWQRYSKLLCYWQPLPKQT